MAQSMGGTATRFVCGSLRTYSTPVGFGCLLPLFRRVFPSNRKQLRRPCADGDVVQEFQSCRFVRRDSRGEDRDQRVIGEAARCKRSACRVIGGAKRSLGGLLKGPRSE